jgi:S-adenosylmethionine hydrolase
MDAADLVVLSLPAPQLRDGALVAHVRYVDRFGNLQLNVGHEDLAQTGLRLGRAASIEPGDGTAHPVHYVRTFADAVPDELLLYEDAQRRLAIAVNHGDAARRLGLAVDDELRIRPG